MWSFKNWKQNQIDAAKDRNNTNTWYMLHPKKANTSIWNYIKSLIRYFFSTKINPDDIDTNDSSFIADL